MLQTRCYTVATNSIRRTLTRVRVIALPFVIAAAANVGGISPMIPQPAYGSEYAWCTQKEGAVQCDFVTREQCQQTASGAGYECIENPRLIAQAPSHGARGKQDRAHTR
ncbi:DUF3551 domain-containing protein [Bradyrhizobium elkanii]|jgi:Protein of unknown function (DUF3551)|uniref:DUF3551 domain-containing protein n=1 Tax=Bradyrhizobium elkanii TaxID=29448 RepID=UPI003511A50B|nr:hypothetical protein [Bradyrhizobium elkanii]